MHHLLLIAHGSRRQASNEAVLKLAARMQAQSGRPVSAAFLELAEPDIETGIHLCVQAGARRLDILPYFLAPGRHVLEDVPRLVERSMQAHPQVQWRLLPHLGASPKLAEFLLNQWQESQTNR